MSIDTRLLIGDAGSVDRAAELGRVDGVHWCEPLGPLIIVEPLGFLRLMNGGAYQDRDGIELYLADGPPIRLRPMH